MTVEEKVITKIRAVILADSVIAGYVGAHVYPTHISQVVKPDYPAISIHLLSGASLFGENGYVNVNIQIDAWLMRDSFKPTDDLKIHERLRALFDRQSITDKTISGLMGVGKEKTIGPTMLEDDTQLLHIPTVYNFRAA